MDLINYAEQSPFLETSDDERTLEDVDRLRAGRFITCYFFHKGKIYTGYEDGLICVWDHTGNVLEPLLGHSKKINCFEAILTLPVLKSLHE